MRATAGRGARGIPGPAALSSARFEVIRASAGAAGARALLSSTAHPRWSNSRAMVWRHRSTPSDPGAARSAARAPDRPVLGPGRGLAHARRPPQRARHDRRGASRTGGRGSGGWLRPAAAPPDLAPLERPASTALRAGTAQHRRQSIRASPTRPIPKPRSRAPRPAAQMARWRTSRARPRGATGAAVGWFVVAAWCCSPRNRDRALGMAGWRPARGRDGRPAKWHPPREARAHRLAGGRPRQRKIAPGVHRA
jgi:hypothetical protein